MNLYGVSFEPIGKQPIVLLKTVDEDRFLPIWIGHAEAAAILMKLQGASPQRPMTHDLLTEVVTELKGEVVKVTVTEAVLTLLAFLASAVAGSDSSATQRPTTARVSFIERTLTGRGGQRGGWVGHLRVSGEDARNRCQEIT